MDNRWYSGKQEMHNKRIQKTEEVSVCNRDPYVDYVSQISVKVFNYSFMSIKVLLDLPSIWSLCMIIVVLMTVMYLYTSV